MQLFSTKKSQIDVIEEVHKDLSNLNLFIGEDYVAEFSSIIRSSMASLLESDKEYTFEEILFAIESDKIISEEIYTELEDIISELNYLVYSDKSGDDIELVMKQKTRFETIMPNILKKADKNKEAFLARYRLRRSKSAIKSVQNKDEAYNQYIVDIKKKESSVNSSNMKRRDSIILSLQQINSSFNDFVHAVTGIDLSNINLKNIDNTIKANMVWDLHVKYQIIKGKSKEDIISYYTGTSNIDYDFLYNIIETNKGYLESLAKYNSMKQIIEIVIAMILDIIVGKQKNMMMIDMLKKGYPKEDVEFVMDELRFLTK